MATRFSEDDIGQEVDALQPRPVGLIEGFESADYALQYTKASVSRLISADPDAMYAFMAQTAKEVLAHADQAKTNLVSLSSSLSASTGNDTKLDEELLLSIAEEFTELRDITYRAKLRKLDRIKSRASTLISTSTGGGSRAGIYKDPVESRIASRGYLSKFLHHLEYVRLLHTSFRAAITDYLASGLTVIAAELQSDLVAERLRDFEGKGGRNASRALVRLLAGIAAVDERLEVRDWSKAKYSGALTILPGTAPYSVSGISLPLSDGSPGSISVTLTGDTGTLDYTAASPPSLSVEPILVTLTGAPPVVQSVFSPQWPNPTASATFKLLVDNTPREVTLSSVGYTAFDSTVISDLNSALLPFSVTCSLVDGRLVVTRTDAVGKGSRARLAFYDTSSGVNDLNETFGLTNARAGEALGSDVTKGDFSLSSFTTPPTLQFTDTLIYRGSGVPGGLGTGNTTFSLSSDHGVIAGDSLNVGSSWYRVASVDSNSLTLDQEILYTFDGAVLDTAGTYSFAVYRRPVTIRHHSKAHGESLVVANPNSLSFPEEATSKYGEHTQCSLAEGLGLGSPVRLGDVLTLDTGLRLGVVSNSQNGVLDVTFDAGQNFSGAAYAIVAKGCHSYGNMTQDLDAISSDIARLPDTDRFSQKVNVYLGSGQNQGLVDSDVVIYLSLLLQLSTIYQNFSANSVAGVNDILRSLKENRMMPAHSLLTACRFSELAALDTEAVSQLGSMQLKLAQVLDALTNNREVYIQRQTSDGAYDQVLDQDTLLPDVPTAEDS